MSELMPVGAGTFPKILYVHDYRPDSRVTADLIRQLFLGFPEERLDWWYCRRTPLYEHPDLRAGRLHEFAIPGRLAPNLRLGALKSWVLEQFWVPRAARHLERAVAEVKPDVVAGLLFGWSVPVLARVRWPSRQRLHLSLWDYPDTNGLRRTLGEARSRRFRSVIYGLIQRASSFDAIGPAMLADLAANTGRSDGLLVHSGFEPQHLRELETAANVAPGDLVRLAYVGTIISEKGFLNMLAALKAVRGASPKPVVLEFFGGRNYRSRDWFEPEWMTEHGMFSDDGLVAALRRCSWGIVVLDPEGEDLQYSRFSFPNKVGTYLAAGVPVLGIGHARSSLAQILREHPVGRFTAATARGEIEQFLAAALRAVAPREDFRAEILRCARSEFNAAEMRARLWRAWGVKET